MHDKKHEDECVVCKFMNQAANQVVSVKSDNPLMVLLVMQADAKMRRVLDYGQGCVPCVLGNHEASIEKAKAIDRSDATNLLTHLLRLLNVSECECSLVMVTAMAIAGGSLLSDADLERFKDDFVSRCNRLNIPADSILEKVDDVCKNAFGPDSQGTERNDDEQDYN